MLEMSVHFFAEEVVKEWNEFILRSRNGTFMHLMDFMSYHRHRYQDFSTVIRKGNEIIAVFPANRVGDTVFSHAGLTYGGLIYGFEQRLSDVRDAMIALVEFYQQRNISKIYYKPVPHIFQKYPSEDDLHVLFSLGARLVRRDLSSVIKFRNRPQMSKKRLSGVKKAFRAGLEMKEGDFLSDFHELLSSVLVRHNATPVHSLQEMRLLQSRFPDNIKLAVARREDRLLAGTWLFKFGDVLHTQYLACSEEGRNLGALDFVISEIIDRSAPEFQFMSFGSSSGRDGQSINEGLVFQKEGFGARTIVLDHYELDISDIAALARSAEKDT
ncbi:GNAT family N-acetyltransferase [Tabrizicola sp.]|uniref:GNAT family N-acetyltransferase n=1 Tax=Tabrizicola sp. TaxID=2005166 RepID=UPI002734E9E4|nr:GNAT family N-acetyltransferase [Tabrizicola sp.]MDP3197166.1 GNAT family N-acetyltransferase [Tabrizicola sp.]MDZ4067897.1 GNAT family N-acetyltransferase [Tabrizicola sp.]